MHQEIIKRASGIINAKTGFIGDGMEGHCVLALIDEYGYPTTSTVTISKANGIHWLTFLGGLEDTKAHRIAQCNRGSVCLSCAEYNITLVGLLEVLVDPATKQEMWQGPIGEYFSGPEDPAYCVLRFNTERYNLYFADDETEAKGALNNTQQAPMPKVTPGLGFRGQCSQALALYQKAFGAELITKLLYSDADPNDFQCKEDEKDFVFYSEMTIGNHLISLGDDSDGALDHAKASPTSLLIEFESVEELNAAYEIISDGATVIKPMISSTYCTAYVSLVDKFGIHWDLMSGYEG